MLALTAQSSLAFAGTPIVSATHAHAARTLFMRTCVAAIARECDRDAKALHARTDKTAQHTPPQHTF